MKLKRPDVDSHRLSSVAQDTFMLHTHGLLSSWKQFHTHLFPWVRELEMTLTFLLLVFIFPGFLCCFLALVLLRYYFRVSLTAILEERKRFPRKREGSLSKCLSWQVVPTLHHCPWEDQEETLGLTCGPIIICYWIIYFTFTSINIFHVNR